MYYYTDKKSLEGYFPFACGETCGEQATHLRFGMYQDQRKRYIMSLTPCVKNDFGFTMNIGLGEYDNKYAQRYVIALAPRFNKKLFEQYATIYNKLVKNLIADKATPEQFTECITNLITQLPC